MCICDYVKNRISTCEKCAFQFEKRYKRVRALDNPKHIILIINLLFYVTNLCVMLLLHYMLVLLPLSGASYCTGYLFIILIYTIVKLNVLFVIMY